MPEKDPLSYELATWAWVFILSSWGGVAGYIGKIKKGKFRFSVAEMIGEIVISAFVGVVTFMLCQAAGISGVLAGALSGITGHMGSRALYLLENYTAKKLEKMLNKD